MTRMDKQRKSGASPSLVRGVNERAVLDVLTGAEELRVAEIATQTGLTRRAVQNVLNSLVGKGWVDELEPLAEGRGRPATRFRLREYQAYVIGLEIGAHVVRGEVRDRSGATLAMRESQVKPQTPRRERVAAALDVIDGMCADVGIAVSEVWYTVAATPATVFEGEVQFSESIPDWIGVKLGSILAEHTGGRCLIANDAALLGWAETTSGLAAGLDDVIVLFLGTPPGVYVQIGGAPVRGGHGRAGDVSGTRLMSPGQLWWATAGTGQTAYSREAALAFTSSVVDAIALMSGALDPQAIVIAGALASQAQELAWQLRAGLTEQLNVVPEVLVSLLGEHGVVNAAARRALYGIEEELTDAAHVAVRPVDRSALS
ncbi:ROK family protein [Kribbella sp. GL6]|uniref:ROK family transcriptional regulator n=1 Tax=Kribbella sp. GL6 TaxID=3419765 RepID=UPI003D017F70